MRREDKRPDKHSDKYKEGNLPVQKKPSAKPDIIRREMGTSKATRGDEWHDPWQRYFTSQVCIYTELLAMALASAMQNLLSHR